MSDAEKNLALLRRDFQFYGRRALRIRTKTGRIEALELNRAQAYVHAALEKQKVDTGRVRAIILKARQEGISTYVEGRFYWRVTGEWGKRAYILTHEQAATDNLFEMVSRFHGHCPDVIKPSTKHQSAKELYFDTLDSGYKIGTAGTKGTGRSSTIQYFHGSEVAFWPSAETHMAGIGQAMPDMPGTEIVLESTANGVGNLFHRMWQAAINGESEYLPLFIPWHWMPEYRRDPPAGFSATPEDVEEAELYDLDTAQVYWRRAKIQDDFQGDVSLFRQEYPATPEEAFLAGSQDSLILPIDCQRASRSKQIEALGPLCMGVDPAEYGDDASAIVLRRGRVVLCVERYHKRGPMELAGIVGRLIDSLSPDAIFVDVVGIGSGVYDRLLELGYRNLIRVHGGERATEDAKYINKRAEMWGLMRDWLRDLPSSIPEDPALWTDLTAPKYTYDSSRRLKLESKENMRNRGVASPDSADALAMTFAYPVHEKKQTAARLARRTTHWRLP
ncbi:MAG: hypothetical protein ACREXW_01045 [Gammaproteobacteria bacterium]